MRAPLHVVAGILSDERGRVLLTQRAAGKHMAGLWEFPGGKVEPGESALVALRREWREELDIDISAAEPLWSVPWRYDEHEILLEVWRITAHAGEPRGREAQALRWVNLTSLDARELPPADRPILAALRLPRFLAITPEPKTHDDAASWIATVARSARDPQRLTLMRAPGLSSPALEAWAEHLTPQLRARVVLHGMPDLAHRLGYAGIHLSAAKAQTLSERPLPASSWVGVSCHNAAELAHAARLDADYVLLGPVLPTSSHPGASALGWAAFQSFARDVPMPVYALGGLAPSDLAQAQAHGAFGVAGISAFWPT